jgi:hypothetical protein
MQEKKSYIKTGANKSFSAQQVQIETVHFFLK